MKYFMNILLPNKNHIQLVIFFAYEWNGDDEEENDEDVNDWFEKFFSVEDLDF